MLSASGSHRHAQVSNFSNYNTIIRMHGLTQTLKKCTVNWTTTVLEPIEKADESLSMPNISNIVKITNQIIKL